MESQKRYANRRDRDQKDQGSWNAPYKRQRSYASDGIEGPRHDRQRSLYDEEVLSRGMRRGGMRGKGPRGYRRSDEAIRDDVCERLTQADDIDAQEMEVRVDGGIVFLSGGAASRIDKRQAEDLAYEVSGVRDVVNQLRIEAETSAERQVANEQGGNAGGEPPPTPEEEPTRPISA